MIGSLLRITYRAHKVALWGSGRGFGSGFDQSQGQGQGQGYEGRGWRIGGVQNSGPAQRQNGSRPTGPGRKQCEPRLPLTEALANVGLARGTLVTERSVNVLDGRHDVGRCCTFVSTPCDQERIRAGTSTRRARWRGKFELPSSADRPVS